MGIVYANSEFSVGTPLSGIPDVPELFIRNLWELENFNLDLFERWIKLMMLGTFFKSEQNINFNYDSSSM